MANVTEQVWAGNEAGLKAYLDGMEREQTLKVDACSDDEEDMPYLLEVQGNVGIVSIKGNLTNRDSYWNRYLGAASYNAIREAVISAAMNPEIDNILLDIDSGGGVVNGCMDTSNLIRMINDKVKPVFAFADGGMCSGAYWLGMAAGKVYAGKTAVVGSIGVISTHMEYSKQLKEDGVGVTVMRAGKFKALANPYEPLSADGKAALQTMLDTTYNVFIEHVAAMRGKTVQYVDDTMAQGREFIGDAAVGAGLVDGITTFDTLVSQLQAQPLDRQQENKQYPYQQQDPYKGTVMKKALTEQQIVALAENGVALDASAPVAQPVVEPAVEAQAVSEVAEPVAEAQAATPEAQAATSQDANIISYLQSQVAEKDKAILAANIELANIRKEHDEFSAVVHGLAEVVAKSLSNLSVALGGAPVDASSMAPVALLAEHKRVSDQFLSKFKAGGVAAVDAADASAEPVKVDPLHKARLASVRSTAKAK